MPKSWSIQRISCRIAGVSQSKVQEVYQSVQIYPCEGPEGQPATLQPYVIDALLNWKRFTYAMANSNIYPIFFLGVTAHLTNNTVIEVTWKNEPIWPKQRHLTKEKLEATKELM